MHARRVRLTVSLAAVMVGACSLDEVGEGAKVDGGVDAGNDVTTTHPMDASFDAGPEASQDVSIEAPRDVMTPTDHGAPDVSCGADTGSDGDNCGSCGHSCIGGACVDGACQPVVIANEGHPWALAVQGKTLFWTRSDENTVNSCALPGCSAVANAGGCPTTLGLAVDSADYYFTCYGGSQIYACPNAGCPGPIGGPPYPTGIAVDSANIYWLSQQTTTGPAGAHTGEVLSEPLGGGTQIVLRGAQDSPSAIVVSAAAPTTLFWTETAEGTVSSCTPASACSDYMQIVTAQNNPDQLVVDSAHVYFTNSGTMPMSYEDGAVVQANLDGSSVVTLASRQLLPRGIVVDSSYVYWVNYVSATATTGTVNRVPIGGGTTVVLATGQASPLGLAQDPAALYWGDQVSGNIVRLAK